MAKLFVRRMFSIVLIGLVISFVLFLIFEGDKLEIAGKVLGAYSLPEQRLIWLEQNGYNEPFLLRYRQWLGRFVVGDWGTSLQYDVPVRPYLVEQLKNTGILGGLVFALTLIFSLILGVISGVFEGRLIDRVVSIFSVLTTSVPEFASATMLAAIFVFWLGILPGTSTFQDGFSWREIILPVAVLVIYNFGYYARMTRASMAEVMTSQYVRTAILKGMRFRRVVMNHALRNALIAPFTVMVLQLNYLLSGVVVVEVFFAYKGFGKMLYDAALFGDIYILEAATMIAVFIAVFSQFISDIGYALLNPRIRFS